MASGCGAGGARGDCAGFQFYKMKTVTEMDVGDGWTI